MVIVVKSLCKSKEQMIKISVKSIEIFLGQAYNKNRCSVVKLTEELV
jgi:hypothetical protein